MSRAGWNQTSATNVWERAFTDLARSIRVRRWATEDPNPVAKIAERKYIKRKGEEGIAAALDPEFVQAVREMDEFEGLVEPRQPDADTGTPDASNRIENGDEEEDTGSRRKRQRIEAPAAVAQPAQPVAPTPTAEPPKGILSAHALESLKYMASLKQQQQSQSAALPVKAPAATTGLGGLAGYGSDSDDE